MAKLVSVFTGSKLALTMTCREFSIAFNGNFVDEVTQFGLATYEADDWDEWTNLVPTSGTTLRIADLPATPFRIYLKSVGADLSLKFDATPDMEIYTEEIEISPIEVSWVE